MDALAMPEMGAQPWQSTVLGTMHACGHDGHTAMLLGAAEILSASRDLRKAIQHAPTNFRSAMSSSIDAAGNGAR
ncbi:M20/M25/M40 family metallo-hydrolase [Bradyrhizobium sp. BRP14]|nr:M20/M25/M40 family metallo-hydrolase [Bradyrhizobium sp. BRP14]